MKKKITFVVLGVLAVALLWRFLPPDPPARFRVGVQPTDDLSQGIWAADLKRGDGRVMGPDTKKVTLHFESFLKENHQKFDSTRDRNAPFSFLAGQRQVVDGLETGMMGMAVGGIRRIEVPAAYAFGDKGLGALVPPRADVIFEVELLKVE